jgi:hypothetical protein
VSPRDRILARRAKFVAAAAATTMGIACSATQNNAEACLLVAADTGVDARDSGPTVCLTMDPGDTEIPDTADTKVDDTSVTDSTADAGPLPCLVPALDSGGD